MIRQVVLLVCSVLLCAVSAQNANTDIYLEQLDGEFCLAGDGDNDQILYEEVADTDGCVPSNMIGIKFVSLEFATKWKAMRLHLRSSPRDWEALIEWKQAETDRVALVSAISLQFDYDINLWKEYDDFIGTSRTNLYRIRNTNELQPGKLYQFTWIRDETCA